MLALVIFEQRLSVTVAGKQAMRAYLRRGPLSPLHPNIVYNLPDKELKTRNHHFVRYANDIVNVASSKRAVKRLMASIRHSIERNLNHKVNASSTCFIRYLSRSLYRRAISQNTIIGNDNGKLTFRYQDSEIHQIVTHTLAGEDFIWMLLMQVLPRRFRRVRDYSFIHHNA